jgi:hypothetical protein
MRFNDAKELLESCGYLIEKIDPSRPSYMTREGVAANRPNKSTSSNIPPHMIGYLSKKSEVCDYIIKEINELIDYISEDNDDGRFSYIIKELIALRNKGNIPMPK